MKILWFREVFKLIFPAEEGLKFIKLVAMMFDVLKYLDILG